MKNLLLTAVTALGIALGPVIANAQERLGDSLLGAAAGAAVGGPVGAVAGGVIGYTGGPHIARGLGVGGHRYRCYRHCGGYRHNYRHNYRHYHR